MRKQNSTFQTAFLSEAGSELENQDYFAYVELDGYACYVVADGLDDSRDAKSARLATQAVILEFQERPSLGKRAIRSYLQAANRALCQADSRERLKASVLVAVTDYEKVRYGYAGNARLRLYRDGKVREQSRDMSLGSDEQREKRLPDDALARHEERNNLYAYAGKGRGFLPWISGKLRLENGDILVMYTRGIWENLDSGEMDDVFSEAGDSPGESLDNIEDLLLSRQPERLENYTLAAVFINKVFQDPERKRKRKKRIRIAAIAAAVILLAGLGIWLFQRWRQGKTEELQRHYGDMIEYLQDNNFVRAEEECKEAGKLAEKLRKKKALLELSDYQKLLEAVQEAEEAFGKGDYEEAQTAYVTARERSRYADRIADAYIEKRLSLITDYRSVFDYLQLGDALAAQGDYSRAEEKYLEARRLATVACFEEGRQDALDCLDSLYELRGQAEEADTREAKEKAVNETGAAQLASEGDKAFAEGDYEGAKAYYAMALEKYQELGDEAHGELIQTKIEASGRKSEENQEKERQADACLEAGREREEAGEALEAKKQYLMAKNLYRELKKEEKVMEVSGRIELLEAGTEEEKENAGAAGGASEKNRGERGQEETEAGEEAGPGREAEPGGAAGPGREAEPGKGAREGEELTGSRGNAAGLPEGSGKGPVSGPGGSRAVAGIGPGREP